MIFVISISLVIHCTFYILIFSRLALYKDKSNVDIGTKKKASVVICYHNEEKNIDKNLAMILRQKIDELVLVDDNSSDKTMDRLSFYASHQVNILSIKSNSVGKKLALSKGINAAKYDEILLTDADCSPTSEKWASHMCNTAGQFVLGYGPMNKTGSLVGLFSQYETYITALQYLSYTLAGIPYMGVGRNMKIDKRAVLHYEDKIKGSQLASGDDDLMINALSKKQNTRICIHPESFMYSDPKNTLKAFLIQKTRHISSSIYYKPTHKLLLSLFSGSQILFYSGLIFVLITGAISFKIALLLLVVKWVPQQAINYSAMKKLKESDLFWKFPFLDILFFVYLLAMPFYYLFNKNNSRWS